MAKKRNLIKLDIACGSNKAEGWTGIDIAGEHADIVHDLFSFPWPVDSGSVGEVNISHFVEHIPHYRPDWGGRDGWFLFWEEVHRICAPGAEIHVVHPYVKSDRAFWDPTHVRFIHEQSWWYLSREWREANKLAHYTDVDFDVVTIAGSGIAEDILARNHEHQAFARQHYWNVLADLTVTLRKPR